MDHQPTGRLLATSALPMLPGVPIVSKLGHATFTKAAGRAVLCPACGPYSQMRVSLCAEGVRRQAVAAGGATV